MSGVGGIRRWLAITMGKRANERSLTLALYATGETAPIATWARDDANATRPESLASEIEEAGNDFAEDQGGGTARMSLRWLDKDGAIVVATTWRAGVAVTDLDGSPESQRMQEQRHVEAMAKLYHATQIEMVGQLRALTDSWRDLLQESRERTKEAEAARVIAEAERDEHKSADKSTEKRGGAVDEVVSMLLTKGAEAAVAGFLAPGVPQAPGGTGNVNPESEGV